MVDHYNLRVQNQGLLPEEMKAVCIDLKGRDDELDGAKFDVIVVRLHYEAIKSAVASCIFAPKVRVGVSPLLFDPGYNPYFVLLSQTRRLAVSCGP